ncbi:MAG: MurR/RpiR family transcriptional regulator [Anaerolineae bacterium]|nr:MurR/RpiR family transcriptional regulator [Anaerolineae bacterium]
MFQERIRENYERLTPGFRKLADYLVSRTLDSAFLTATELSRQVGVDPATVVRFAQELGYSGYRELSREIKSYVRDQVTANYRKATEAGTTQELLSALVDNAQQNMQNFVTTDLGHVAQAVDTLKEATKIWIIGEYADYDIAEFMAKQFKKLGIAAAAFYPSMSEAASYIPQMQETDVLLALDSTGPSVDTGYTMRMGKDKGVQTLCITGSGVTLASREAALTINIPTKTPASVASYNAFVQVLSLIWETIAKERTEATEAQINGIQENLEKYREYRLETPEYEILASQASEEATQ